MLPDHEVEIRVRYYETDGQGFVHHANFLQYFELARVEQLLALVHNNADFERDGLFLVVKKLAVNYHQPSRFGDVLQVQIRTVRAKAARIAHAYKVLRAKTLIAEGKTTLACIDRAGQGLRLASFLIPEY